MIVGCKFRIVQSSFPMTLFGFIHIYVHNTGILAFTSVFIRRNHDYF